MLQEFIFQTLLFRAYQQLLPFKCSLSYGEEKYVLLLFTYLLALAANHSQAVILLFHPQDSSQSYFGEQETRPYCTPFHCWMVWKPEAAESDTLLHLTSTLFKIYFICQEMASTAFKKYFQTSVYNGKQHKVTRDFFFSSYFKLNQELSHIYKGILKIWI